MISFWGAQRRLRTPHGHKAMGRVRERDVPPPMQSAEAKIICFKHSFKSKATLKNKVTYHFSSQSACSLLLVQYRRQTARDSPFGLITATVPLIRNWNFPGIAHSVNKV